MTPLVQTFTTIVSIGIVFADIFILYFLFILLTQKNTSRASQKIFQVISRYGIELGFLVTLAGVVTSLFYSNIAGFAPCDLCWWQRIFIYPQFVIFGVALYRKWRNRGDGDQSVYRYSGALSIIGTLIAAYHYYGQTFAEGILPCNAAAVSCSKLYFLEFGYITIPVMSLTGFLLLLIIVISHRLARSK